MQISKLNRKVILPWNIYAIILATLILSTPILYLHKFHVIRYFVPKRILKLVNLILPYKDEIKMRQHPDKTVPKKYIRSFVKATHILETAIVTFVYICLYLNVPSIPYTRECGICICFNRAFLFFIAVCRDFSQRKCYSCFSILTLHTHARTHAHLSLGSFGQYNAWQLPWH